MDLTITPATADDAATIAALRTAAAERLTREFGKGHWSAAVPERSVIRLLGEPGVFVARDAGELLATFRLGTRKAWAIDPAYFTDVGKPLYLPRWPSGRTVKGVASAESPSRKQRGLREMAKRCDSSRRLRRTGRRGRFLCKVWLW